MLKPVARPKRKLWFMKCLYAAGTLLSLTIAVWLAGCSHRTSASGVLLSASDAPQSKTQVRLVKVRLVSLVGEEIRTLPLKDTAIIDSDGKAVAVAETESSGRFEFKNVPAGRYSLAVPSKVGGSTAGQLWLESRGRTVFFDIADNQRVELGTVKAEKQK
jgi:hypothetical protein